MKDTCANCGFIIHGIATFSSVYGAEKKPLCEVCAEEEGRIINLRGTNDIPWLREQYLPDNKWFWVKFAHYSKANPIEDKDSPSLQ